MLPKFWREVLKDGWKVSDCKIISTEGKETLTHKIVLAAKIEFFRTILADIPEGHDAVIILPDFSSDQIDIFMQKILSESKIASSLWDTIVKAEELNTGLWRECEIPKDEIRLNAEEKEIMDEEPVATETKLCISKEQEHE